MPRTASPEQAASGSDPAPSAAGAPQLHSLLAEAARAGWAAGIIDTDGSIRVHQNHTRSGPPLQLTLRVENTSQRCIERLHEVFGVGTLRRQEPRGGRRASWRWFCGGKAGMRAVLQLIRPYVVVKSFEVECALQFLETDDESKKAAIYEKLKPLKNRSGPRTAERPPAEPARPRK